MSLPNFLRLVTRSWRIVLGFIVTFLFLAIFYNFKATPEYAVRATFYLNNDPGISTFSSSLLGLNSNDLQKKIFAFVKSDLMKNQVAAHFQPTFQKPIKIVRGKLRLDTRIALAPDENGTLVLSYRYKNPKIAYEVVQTYLQTLSRLNEDLNLSGKKDFIVVLDAPEIPSDPSFPKKILNILLAIFSGLSLSVLFIMIREFYFRNTGE